MKLIETERLLLKPTQTDDAEFVLELLNTPKWKQFIGDRNVNVLDDAVKYIEEKMLPQYERLGYANYTVIRKSDNTKLGSCGLYDREGLEGIDIGFAFLPQFEGKGYAFESANKLMEVAFSEFGITSISGITIEENMASRKLLEKLGLKFVSYKNIPGDDEELMLYKIEKHKT